MSEYRPSLTRPTSRYPAVLPRHISLPVLSPAEKPTLAVNQPYLPDFSHYQRYVKRAFDNKWLTNNGPLLQEFQQRLQTWLGLPYVLPVANGTLAMQIAYAALNVSQRAVTTPFTFVATSSSLQWQGIAPDFADIDAQSCNLHPLAAERAIRAETTALVPVHVYGNPCDVDALDELGKRYGLKVIYDAAQAFGVNVRGSSVLRFGDASTVSFHATKVFHAVEGGLIVFRHEEDYLRAAKLINFGIDSRSGDIVETGINAKMSEVHAAMGLALLDNIDEILARRREQFALYRHLLADSVQMPQWHQEAEGNGAYMPVIFHSAAQCQHTQAMLEQQGILSRRYFSPALNTVPHFAQPHAQPCPMAESYATRMLCLPLYYTLADADIRRVCASVKRSLQRV